MLCIPVVEGWKCLLHLFEWECHYLHQWCVKWGNWHLLPKYNSFIWYFQRIKLGGTENLYGRRIHRIHEANLQRKEVQSELFVDRERLTSTLYQFWESDKTLFPLLGEAGQGKTSQLCYWTEKLLEQKKAVLIFNGADFSNYTLEQKIKALFSYNYKKPIARLLTSLHEKAEQNKAYVYFFFDAINECLHYYDSDGQEEGPLHLYRSIRQLLYRKNSPGLKSCSHAGFIPGKISFKDIVPQMQPIFIMPVMKRI